MGTELELRNSGVKRKPYPKRQAWYDTFLKEYMDTGRVGASAAKAGVTPEAVYKARDTNEEFGKAYELARNIVGDELEGVAIDRAKKHSDTMLIFLLKGFKPDIYGDRVRNEMSGPGGKAIKIKLVYDEE